MTKVIEPSEICKCLDLEDLPGEVWKDINGYEGNYQISSMGRVKSLGRFINRGSSGGVRWECESILKPYFQEYFCVKLYSSNLIKTVKVHRMVAIHHIPNPENKKEVNHKKGLKWDNRVTELEWVTKSENQKHAIRTGLKTMPVGENHHASKLTKTQVIEIRRLAHMGESHKKIATIYGVNRGTISDIARRKTWKYLTHD